MITLPFPPRTLHPNARPHWAALRKAAKAYRNDAFYAALAAGVGKIDAEEVSVFIVFHPPNRRKHDLDGMLSAIKSGLDGIADAIGVDDSKWKITIEKSQPEKGGKVSVAITGIRNEQGSGS